MTSDMAKLFKKFFGPRVPRYKPESLTTEQKEFIRLLYRLGCHVDCGNSKDYKRIVEVLNEEPSVIGA